MKSKNCIIQKPAKEFKSTENVADEVILNPRTDIFENKNDIVIISEMSGVDEKGLDVSFEDKIISFAGTIDSEIESHDYRSLREEFINGRYERSFSVLADINVDKISAKMKNGVLTVLLPKSEKVKPRKIKIKSE